VESSKSGFRAAQVSVLLPLKRNTPEIPETESTLHFLHRTRERVEYEFCKIRSRMRRETYYSSFVNAIADFLVFNAVTINFAEKQSRKSTGLCEFRVR
jgi:hypothetical protein